MSKGRRRLRRNSIAGRGATPTTTEPALRGGTRSIQPSPNALSPDGPPEIDSLSFAVRAQKFRVAATVMKRSPVPLATEYAVRLVHLVPDVTAEEIAAFFGFGAAETRVLIQDMLESQLIAERDGRFTLSSRGREAASDQLDDIELFVTEEVTAHQAFDLIAFAPVDDAELTGGEARLVPEVAIPDRERAARAIAAAGDAFDHHFQEWHQRHGPRRRPDDVRLHAVDDVQLLRTFAAPFHLPVRYRLDDAVAGVGAAEPDFSGLRNRGRPGSRNALIAAFSARVQGLKAPGDHEDAFAFAANIDGGVLAGVDLRSAAGQAAWALRCASEQGQLLNGSHGPGRRLLGSSSSEPVRTALLSWTSTVEAERLYVPTPVIWLPPRALHWGRSIAFATLLRDLAAANPDGTALLARTDGTPRASRDWARIFGPRDRQVSLFDRCLAVRTHLPDALELAVKPGAWALVLVHTPEAVSGYPLAVGYLTAAPHLVSSWRHALAEVAASAAGSRAMLWHGTEDTPERALATLDLALGIEAA